MELILVRHGRTAWNEARRYQGRSDPPLSEAGRDEARGLRGTIRVGADGDGPVWCSTLRRSRETARLVFPEREPRSDPRLDELDFGHLEGLTHRQAIEELGESYERWIADPERGAPPGGESLEELRARVYAWLRELPLGRTHVAVSHFGPIRVLAAAVLDVPLARAHRLKLEPGDSLRLLIPSDHDLLRSSSDEGDSRAPPLAAPPGAATDPDGVEEQLEVLVESVALAPGPDAGATRRRLDALAKPPGSLGRLEDLASRLARVVGESPPSLSRRRLFVFLADHGVARRGVSAYPREVTAGMAEVFSREGAGSQALASACGVEVVPVDVGVDTERESWPGVVSRRVRRGTRDLAEGPAMTIEETRRALLAGAEVVHEHLRRNPTRSLVAVGEMGIGNTTAASAVACALTGRPVDELVGPGTGVRGETLERKRAAVRGAVQRLPEDSGPVEVLAEAGGLEIAAMAGAVLAAAGRGRPVLLDGFISTTAGLVATRLSPEALSYLFASHRSAEPGHRILLDVLSLAPILELEMRLGEGTGAVLAAPILDAVGAILREMARLEEVESGDS
ncbi:MAG: nicotinate-nucleotide--dimethylbenzimidazole phosphoribosyltransferase [Gemmatimonadota bacterium]|nr:nicotinate-nucleotide--dimethylbenzimidazole phosphoribosyltransferase [Gemmatimonadota bacterium]